MAKKSGGKKTRSTRRSVSYKYLDKQINDCSRMIISHGDRADDFALGRLNVLMSFRRQATNNESMYDKGVIDAVNDILTDLGYVGRGKIFMDF